MKISVVFGTRPEVIKLALLIKELEKRDNITLDVCFTGQHKEMVLPLIDFFELKINSYLDLMQPNQTLSSLTARTITAMDGYCNEVKPDVVIVQGDTTTAMSAALTAFYHKVKVAHVEAGLRTHNMLSPFPEEMNRSVISLIAGINYAPTKMAMQNLEKEGVNADNILVSGNTVIDALFFTLEKVKQNKEYKVDYTNGEKIVLITGHRRENFGDGFENICFAIKALAEKYQDFQFIYPVHLNPNVQEPVRRILNGAKNIKLIPPVDYIQFTQLMEASYLILTDSGGIQEEAPSIGKPVLVMRDTTERPEAVLAGAAKLVGTDKDEIIENVSRLIDSEDAYNKMSQVMNPFGDGTASRKIADHLLMDSKL